MEKIRVGKLQRYKRRRPNLSEESERTGKITVCMKALLNHPWIEREKDPQVYYWIKEQSERIREWFMYHTGYSLTINRKLAKLEKVPVVAFPWMGFQEFRGPLDYALFTYSLWYLESKAEGEQFLLTDLVKEIRAYMNEQGMGIDWQNYFQRLSMARALKKLKNMNIIQAVDGKEADWADRHESNDVLYECSAYSRYVLRNFPRDLASYETMEEMGKIPAAGDEQEEMNQVRRYRLYRRYLFEPVILDKEWKDDLLYFHGQKNYLIRQLKLMFGWEGSKYREGILFFEPEIGADSELFPTLSSLSDLSMLVCAAIRHKVSNPDQEIKLEPELDGSVWITKSEIGRILIQLKGDYEKYWISDHRKIQSSSLADLVCGHLIEWGFAQWEERGFLVLNAAAGRWQVQYGATEFCE